MIELPVGLRRLAADYAAHFQLGVPANIRLDRIHALRADAVAACAQALEAVGQAARGPEQQLPSEIVRLRTHWSAQAAPQYLQQLQSAASTLRAALAPVTARAAELAATIGSAQQSTAATVASTSAAADWDAFETTHTPEWQRRFELAGSLVRAVAAQDARVTAALQTFCSALSTAAISDPAFSADGGSLAPPASESAAQALDLRLRAQVHADLRDPDPTVRKVAAGVERALAAAQQRGGAAQLLVYESRSLDGQGRAAITIGDLATADHSAVLVPGSNSSVQQMADSIQAGGDLLDQARAADPGSQTAVTVWSGYNFPLSFPGGLGDWRQGPAETGEALSTDVAVDGGRRLAADLQLITALAPKVAAPVVIGHSMGASTVSQAMTHPARVQAVVLLAAPGAGPAVTTAGDYQGVDRRQTFVVAHEQDVITQPAVDLAASAPIWRWFPYGRGPERNSFQAQQVDVPTGAHRYASPLAHHSISNYLTGASGQAVAAVVVGRTSQVPRKLGRRDWFQQPPR